MKAHIGVDTDSGLVHTGTTTPANVADVTQTGALLHGDEEVVYADAGYTGAAKRAELEGVAVTWRIAERRSAVQRLAEGEYKESVKCLEHLKAKMRARVEQPFRVIKRQFGYTKVRYRGFAKNTAPMFMLFASSHLWMARRRFLAAAGD